MLVRRVPYRRIFARRLLTDSGGGGVQIVCSVLARRPRESLLRPSALSARGAFVSCGARAAVAPGESPRIVDEAEGPPCGYPDGDRGKIALAWGTAPGASGPAQAAAAAGDAVFLGPAPRGMDGCP